MSTMYIKVTSESEASTNVYWVQNSPIPLLYITLKHLKLATIACTLWNYPSLKYPIYLLHFHLTLMPLHMWHLELTPIFQAEREE